MDEREKKVDKKREKKTTTKKKKGKKFKATLGVGQWGINCEVTPTDGYCRLSAVFPGSIAEKSGLRVGDRIIAIGGDKIRHGIDMKDLFALVGKHKKKNKPVVLKCSR